MYLCINVLGTVDSKIIKSLSFTIKGHVMENLRHVLHDNYYTINISLH